jgi:competence protein ComEA
MTRWLAIAFFASIAVVLFAAQDDLPAGKGRDALQQMCTNCHGLDQITSNHYSKKYWGSVVDDMVSRGAVGTDDQISLVIGYLARNFGKPVNINTATAKDIEDDLSFPAAQAEAVVKYRTDKGAFKTFADLQRVPGLDAGLLDEEKANITF